MNIEHLTQQRKVSFWRDGVLFMKNIVQNEELGSDCLAWAWFIQTGIMGRSRKARIANVVLNR